MAEASGCTVKPDVRCDGYISSKKPVRVVLDVHLENPSGSPGESAEIERISENE